MTAQRLQAETRGRSTRFPSRHRTVRASSRLARMPTFASMQAVIQKAGGTIQSSTAQANARKPRATVKPLQASMVRLPEKSSFL
jgi:hypothetical protein